MDLIRKVLENHDRIGSAIWELLRVIDTGQEPVSINRMALDLGKTRRGVQRTMRKLESAGVLQREPSAPGKAHRYRVTH